MIQVRLAGPADQALLEGAPPDVFDDPVNATATRAFLASETHHLVIAEQDGRLVGMASAVHYLHPDKPAPEMWINEVSVAEPLRLQGVGNRMIDLLREHALTLGCRSMWVLTDRTNAAARALYASRGGVLDGGHTIMYEWSLGRAEQG